MAEGVLTLHNREDVVIGIVVLESTVYSVSNAAKDLNNEIHGVVFSPFRSAPK